MPQANVGRPERRSAQRLIARYLEDARRVYRGRNGENGTGETNGASGSNSSPSSAATNGSVAGKSTAQDHSSTATKRPSDLSRSAIESFALNAQLHVRIDGKIARELVQELVEPNLFYVVQAASEYRSSGVPFEELLAEGNIGLVEAAHRYDPGHGVKFLTYASWWIRKRILDYLSNEGKAVRLTRYARERRRDLNSLRDAMRSDLGRDPSMDELANASGLDVEVVKERLTANPRVMSLDQPNPTYGSLFDRLADRNIKPVEDRIDEKKLGALVRREVAKLPQRERRIIENRFGLDGRDALTFQDLGDILGLSRERARQLEREALRRLRKRLQRALSN